jgi:plastocyanin
MRVIWISCNRLTSRAASALVLVTLISACSSSSSEAPPASSEKPAPAPAAAADESGTYTVQGSLPPAIGGFPSIVLFERSAPVQEADPPVTLEMDQVQQTFIPAVLMVRTGHPVNFRNSDEVLHNVRVREDATHSPAFNVAIPTGEKYTFTFPRDGFYDVGCDIHPGMAAQIVATGTPYSAVADASGAYSIPGVPSGTYKVVVFTGSQKIEREVTVARDQTRIDVAP